MCHVKFVESLVQKFIAYGVYFRRLLCMQCQLPSAQDVFGQLYHIRNDQGVGTGQVASYLMQEK